MGPYEQCRWEPFPKINKRVGPNKAMLVGSKKTIRNVTLSLEIQNSCILVSDKIERDFSPPCFSMVYFSILFEMLRSNLPCLGDQ